MSVCVSIRVLNIRVFVSACVGVQECRCVIGLSARVPVCVCLRTCVWYVGMFVRVPISRPVCLYVCLWEGLHVFIQLRAVDLLLYRLSRGLIVLELPIPHHQPPPRR